MTDIGSVGGGDRRSAMTKTSVLSVGMGNAVELYDWTIFAAFSTYFASQIFPDGNRNLALLSVFGTYAVSFFFRPLGGIVIGRFADIKGRRSALLLCVTMMAGGSLVIAGIPSFDHVGWFSPVLLLLVRIAQGLAMGGETTSAAAYIVELAPSDRRGRYGAAFYISSGVASLSAALVGLGLTSVFNAEQMTDWAWRLPFVFGAALGLVTLYLRRNLPETDKFKQHSDAARFTRTPLRYILTHHWREGLLVLGVCAGGSIGYYTVFSALTPFLISQHEANARDVFFALLVGTVIFMAMLYPFGALSDTIGRRAQLIVFSIFAAALLGATPWIAGPALWQLLTVFGLGGTVIAIFSSQNTILTAELFPTKVRAVSLGLWLNLCAALFGGSAPFILQGASASGNPSLFFFYAATVCAWTTVPALFVRDMRSRELD